MLGLTRGLDLTRAAEVLAFGLAPRSGPAAGWPERCCR